MGNLKTGTKILLGFVFAVVIAVVIGIVGYRGITQLGAQMNEVSEVRLPSVTSLGDITTGQLNAAYATRGLINRRYFQDAELRKTQFDQIETSFKQIQAGLDIYTPLPQADEEKKVWDQYIQLLDKWRKQTGETVVGLAKDKERIYLAALAEAEAQGLTGKEAIDAAEANEKLVAADNLLYTEAGEARKLMREGQPLLEQVIEINEKLADQSNKDGKAAVASSTSLMFGALGFGALVMLILGVFLGRSIGKALGMLISEAKKLSDAAVAGQLATRADPKLVDAEFRPIVTGVNDCLDAVIGPLNVAAEYVDRISKGDIPPKITDKYNGDFNEIKNNLNQCIDSLSGLVADMNNMSKQHDLGDIDVMVSEDKFDGAYKTMAKGVNTMVGGHIAVKKKAMACIGEFGRGNFEAPMDKLPGKKAFINDTIEQVRANLKALIADTNILVQAAADGKLDTRADASKHQGDFRKIVQGVNDTITNIVDPLMVTADYVDKVSKGVIPPTIVTEYKGQYNLIKTNLNNMVKMMNDLLSETDKIVIAAADGQLDKRADAAKFVGGWNKLVSGINDTITNIVNPLMVTANYVDKISKGNIPAPITDEYKGQYNLIKTNLNQCVIAVNALVADALLLAKAAVEGRLDTRADASKHQGDFAKIVKGVNDTLDAVLDPIKEASNVLESLSNYDLRARVKGNYQGDHAKIKNSLNETGEALHNALVQVAEAVDQISSAGGQIASSSQQVAEGASEQASSLEETSSSLEEMASMTKQNAENTQQTKALTDATKTVADRGASSMSTMVEAMGKIRTSAENTAEIIKDINEIAFQTNLLALNAAVEAARAGDAGRGFAVVAEEVRNLAGRAKEAAKKTEELIKQSVQLSESGAEISKAVNGDLNEIVTSVGKVADIVGEITVASQEQSRGIDQVNKAVAEMDKVVQQSAANSEESSSAAEELAGQAQELASMVSKFQLNRTATHRAVQKTTHKVASSKTGAKAKHGNGNAHPPGWSLDPESIIPMADDPDFASF